MKGAFRHYDFVELELSNNSLIRLTHVEVHQDMIDFEVGTTGEFHFTNTFSPLLVISKVNGRCRVSCVQPGPLQAKDAMDLFFSVALFPITILFLWIHLRMVSKRRDRLRANGYSESNCVVFN